MNYNEKVEWLREAKEAMKDTPFCDEFYVDLVNVETEVYNYERNVFGVIKNSIKGNMNEINQLDQATNDCKSLDFKNYCEAEKNNHIQNIRELCFQVQKFYFLDRIRLQYKTIEPTEDNKNDLALSFAILDDVLLDNLTTTKTHQLTL